MSNKRDGRTSLKVMRNQNKLKTSLSVPVHSVNIWYDAVGDHFLIFLPVFSVSEIRSVYLFSEVNGSDALFLAILIVPKLTVDQQDQEIRNIEVRDRRIKPCRQRPGQGHEKVTTITREIMRVPRGQPVLTNSWDAGSGPTIRKSVI